MKNFIIITLDDLTLAQRIYRWMILLLHEEFIIWTLILLHEEFIVERFYSCMKNFIIKWFYSYMKNFIIIALDNLILAQRIYHWTILLLHEEFIVEFLGQLLLEWIDNHVDRSCSFFGNFVALGLLETMLLWTILRSCFYSK